jgi:hypothetical protein
LGLKPYRGDIVHKTVTYKIPEDASGTLRLNVRGGAVLNWIQALLRQQKEAGIPTANAKKKATQPDLRSYVKKINDADRNNDIIIDYATSLKASTLKERLAAAKAKAKDAKNDEDAESVGELSNRTSDLTSLLAGSPHKQKTAMDFIVDGETNVSVKVQG